MRVLLVTGSLPPMKCGVGDYTWKLASKLATHSDISVAILTSRGAADPEVSGTTVFPVMDRWGLKEIGRLIRVLRQWSPDLIHLQYPGQGFGAGIVPSLAPLIALLFGAKFVSTWHELSSWESISNPRELFRFLFQLALPGSLIVVRPKFRLQLHPLLRAMIRHRPLTLIENTSAIPKAVIRKDDYDRIRANYLRGAERLIVFFGFLYPPKGAELIFDVADPHRDRVVIVGDWQERSQYHQFIRSIALAPPWGGKVTMAGFLSDEATAELLAVSDAVLLPFKDGGGIWNTSILAAVAQGTFVITTSYEQSGLDQLRNVYFAKPGNVAEMRRALGQFAGSRRSFSASIDNDGWHRLADQHRNLYGLS